VEVPLTNRVGSVQQIQIDFGDGSGYRTVLPGQVININYSGGGNRSVRVKLISVGGAVLQTHTDIVVTPKAYENYNWGNRFNLNIPGAIVTLVSTCGNRLTPGICRPFIVVEGFNAAIGDFDEFQTDLNSFRARANTTGNFDNQIPGRGDLIQELDDAQYDLIYVDFNDGTAALEDNAVVVRNVIREVNRLKAESGCTERNIIYGISMGGVIAKLVLLEMERDGEDHQTKKLLTHDSPLRGANIPLGYQYMLEDVASIRIATRPLGSFLGILGEAEAVLSSPAAQQMLIYHKNTFPTLNPRFVQFYTNLRNLGALRRCEHIALSNGSQLSNGQGFEPNARIVTIQGQTDEALFCVTDNPGVVDNLNALLASLGTGAAFDFQVRALPSREQGERIVYQGALFTAVLGIPVVLHFTKKTVTGTIPLDNAPGGRIGLDIPTCGPLQINQPAFCFVPAVSAIEVGPFQGAGVPLSDVNQNLSNNNVVINSGQSSVDRYVAGDESANTPVEQNQNHVIFTQDIFGSVLYETTFLAGVNNPINGRTYNYGESPVKEYNYRAAVPNPFPMRRTSFYIENNLTVSGADRLWINRAGRIGFTNNTNNPFNQTSGTFSVFMSRTICNNTPSIVTVESGGQMRVGEWGSNAQNIGLLYIRAGNRIVINNGGTVTVENNSTVFVQNGGRIEVNSGGMLDVTNANGRLEVESGAEVRVRAGGILRMSNKGGAIVRGGGRLILESGAIVQLWDGNNDDGESFVRIESGGTLRIEGDLNLSGNGFFWFKAGFVLEDLRQEFNFTGLRKSCRLFRFDGAQVNITNRNVNLTNLQIEYTNSAQFKTTGGMILLTDISLEGYKDGSIGLRSEQSTSFQLTRTDFIGLSDGLIAENNPVLIRVNDGLFKDCQKGITGSATFIVTSTMFTIWDFAGIELGGGSVTLNNCKMDDGNIAAGPGSFGAVQARMNGGPLEPGIFSLNGATVAVNGGSIQNCETGIFMNSGGSCYIRQGASISSNQVGIHAPNGGGVLMNCSQLTNNGIGVLGVGTYMEVVDGCNLFGIAGGFSKLFYLCNTDPSQVDVSGNRWMGNDAFWSPDKWHISNGGNCYFYQGNSASEIGRDPKCQTLSCSGQPPSVVYDMEVRLALGSGSVLNLGGTAFLKIIVSNKSDNFTSSGKVKFTLPAGLNFVSMQGPPGMNISYYDWVNRQFYFTNLFAGSELEVVVRVQIDAGFTGNRLTVTAELVEDNNTSNPWFNTPDIDSEPNNNNRLEDDQNELLLIVTPAPLGPLTSVISQTPAQCQANGTITLAVSGGKPPYRFDWADMAGNSNPQNRNNLSGGTYTVTVFDANGSTLVSSALVARNEAPGIAVAVTHIGCNNPLNTGFIDLTVTGGSTPYTYAWSDWPHTFEDRPGMAPNTYTVTVTSANGCSATASMVVQRLPGLTFDVVSQAVTCSGQNNGTLSIQAKSGAAPYTYAWSDGNTSSTRSNLAAGTYTVTVRDSYNCSATTQAIVGAPVPMNAILVKDDAACGQNNGNISTSVSGGNGGYRFDWADIAGFNDPGDRYNLAPGTYNVTVRDGQNCVALASTTIGQSPALNFTAASGSTGCAQNSGSITLSIQTGTGPYAFNWADLSGSGQPQNRSGLAGGTYAVTVTDSKGCSKSTAVQVTQSGGPSVTANATSVACFNNTNGSITLNVSGGAGGYVFDWEDMPGNANPQNRSMLAAGTYIVTVRDAAQCAVVRSVTVVGPSALAVNLSPTHIRCYGTAEGAITVNVSGGTGSYTYDWTDVPGTSNAQNRSGLRGGSYTVLITDANGCKTEASVTVEEPMQLSLRGTPIHPTCTANIGAINLTPSGGTKPYTYLWSNGQVTEDISGLGAGTYVVTVTDNKGCFDTWRTELISPLSVSASVAVSNVNCYGGNNGGINLLGSGGQPPYTYNFGSNPGGSSTNPIRTGLIAGTYTITITDAIGCTGTIYPTINQPPAIVVDKTITPAVCPNNPTVTINASGGTSSYTYKWSDLSGGTGPSVRTVSPGDYTVTVTDGSGCIASKSFPVSCSPSVSISSFDDSDKNSIEERGQIKNQLPHDVMIYPNPANDAFTIQSDDSAVYQFRLIDALGRIVRSGQGTGATSVPAAELPPGLYHVRIELSTDEQPRILWKKVVVTHP
jgi:SprB repeat/Secretion system C-terminal sorting domain